MKAYFLSRLTREKYLVLALLLIGVAIWGNTVMKRARHIQQTYSATKHELEVQDRWLASKAQIEADAAAAIARLEPARTLDSTKLLAEANRMAAEAGITANLQVDDIKDEHSAQFALHSLRLTMKKVDYPSLVKFYVELQKRSPYIGLEQFSLQSEPSNPAQLTAIYRLTSVEVLRAQ